MNLPTESLKQEMIEWRHDIHQYPEVGFNEFRTTSFIIKLLNQKPYLYLLEVII